MKITNNALHDNILKKILYFNSFPIMTRGTSRYMRNVKHLITEDVVSVGGLAVDWVRNHLYWTDQARQSISVAQLEGRPYQKTLIRRGSLDSPRDIVLDPRYG